MSWSILFLDAVERELEQVFLWELEDSFSEPQATRTVDRILDAAASLKHAPFAHMLHPNPELEKSGVRYKVVGGRHVIYFIPDERSRSIRIYHVLHRRADASTRRWK